MDAIVQKVALKKKEVDAKVHLEKPFVVDLGSLTVWDPDTISLPKNGSARDKYLLNLARDATQAVINGLTSLDTHMSDSYPVVKLPESRVVFPRAKPLPKPKDPSKWESFAKQKGITKKKDSKKNEKLVWDDTSGTWVPRHGYKRVKNEQAKDWLIEVPDNADPNVDYFAKKKEEKKERVAKNEYQRLKNVKRQM
ncbi:Ribosome biogenesis regulatory protein-like protein, partial [Fragariocoptes setiger]